MCYDKELRHTSSAGRYIGGIKTRIHMVTWLGPLGWDRGRLGDRLILIMQRALECWYGVLR